MSERLLVSEQEIKGQVREFYDSVGWKQIGDGIYQNARYEDLRPVSREYIRRCHLRVARFLPQSGKFLLDAGSGPIQYPQYLEYSRGFQYRVCLDISTRALKEARERIGNHGLYVVGDIAHLPFKEAAFDGIVSLHTVHHLPPQEHSDAFWEFFRALKPGGKTVVVYTWGDDSPLMRLLRKPIAWTTRLLQFATRIIFRADKAAIHRAQADSEAADLVQRPGTFTTKHNFPWVKETLGLLPGLEVRVWRSVSTPFLRAFIHRKLFGKYCLRLLYWLEERAPHFFGRVGQYPLICFNKNQTSDPSLVRFD
jgi:SAM-dependent methyltransferase